MPERCNHVVGPLNDLHRCQLIMGHSDPSDKDNDTTHTCNHDHDWNWSRFNETSLEIVWADGDGVDA